MGAGTQAWTGCRRHAVHSSGRPEAGEKMVSDRSPSPDPATTTTAVADPPSSGQSATRFALTPERRRRAGYGGVSAGLRALRRRSGRLADLGIAAHPGRSVPGLAVLADRAGRRHRPAGRSRRADPAPGRRYDAGPGWSGPPAVRLQRAELRARSDAGDPRRKRPQRGRAPTPGVRAARNGSDVQRAKPSRLPHHRQPVAGRHRPLRVPHHLGRVLLVGGAVVPGREAAAKSGAGTTRSSEPAS